MTEDPARREPDDVHQKAEQAVQQFAADLETYRIRCGAPKVGSLANDKTRGMSKASLSEIFNGKRFPTLDVTASLVGALAAYAAKQTAEHGVGHQANAAELRAQVAEWRQRWTEVMSLKNQADKESRRARASNERIATDIVATAERQARRILSAAVEEAARLTTQAQTEAQAAADELLAGTQIQVATEVARLRPDAIQRDKDTAARVLSLAQMTADEAIAEARREAARIVDEAKQLIPQNASGMSLESLGILATEVEITGRVVAHLTEGVLVKLVEPGSVAGFEAYVHTGADTALYLKVGALIGVIVGEVLARPILLGQVAFMDPPDSDRWRGVSAQR